MGKELNLFSEHVSMTLVRVGLPPDPAAGSPAPRAAHRCGHTLGINGIK